MRFLVLTAAAALSVGSGITIGPSRSLSNSGPIFLASSIGAPIDRLRVTPPGLSS